MALSLGAGLGIAAAGSLLSGITSYLTGEHMMDKQAQSAKDMWDYQWNKAYSPQAQVRNIASAGVNPAAQFGSHSVLAGSPQASMPSLPSVQYGLTGLSDLANYIAAGAQAKKSGVEIPGIEADTQGKLLDNDRKAFENDLLKRYGLQKSAAELALAEQNVKLALASTDVALQEKSLKEWQTSKEKALSEVNEKQRDILQKELDNKDIELDIRNRQGEANIGLTKSQSNAANASAEASRAQAVNLSADTETKTIFNKFYKDRRYQHSFMSQVVEQGKQAVSQRLVTDRQAEQLEYLVEQAAYSNDMKEFSYWSGQVNQFVNTLGSAASQFYGAGALRELIHIRQAQQQPPPSIRGFGQ